MGNNPVLDKSRLFSVRIVRLYKYLANTKNEYVMSRQLLKSGTSVGANIAEGQYAISKKEKRTKTNLEEMESIPHS